MKFIDIIVNKLMQGVLSIVKRFLRQPHQLTFCGSGSAEQLCGHIARLGFTKVLLVTDQPLVKLGLAGTVAQSLKVGGAQCVIYDGVQPDPTVSVVQGALDCYRQNDCDAVLALGGGSSIDTAKLAAAAATNGEIEDVMGLFKVKLPPAPLFAIPTTAGTGSEISIFAVISDDVTHQKTGVGDTAILPKATALDPTLMVGLPKPITAATGLDALTHAVETYTGTAATVQVKEYSSMAVRMIFRYLPVAYEEGDNIEAREAMAIASYYAGVSLNAAAVGNVHAIAHQLGSRYGTPHGLANAIVMPHVLDMNIGAASAPLAELAELIGIAGRDDSEHEKAEKFVAAIRDLNTRLGIPAKLDVLRTEDIPQLAIESVKEGRTYAVPLVMARAQAASILNKLVA